MMIFRIILIGSFFSACFFKTHAQVGINTLNPLGVFHVHIGATNSTINDIVVSADGNLGIHEVNPQAKLDLKGTFIVSGIPDIPTGEEYVIVSDADGTFNANEPGSIPTIQGNIPSNLTSLAPLPVSGAAVNYSSINIELPKGMWIVYFMATNWVNGSKISTAAAEANVIKWQLINKSTGSDDNIRADYSSGGFINSYTSTACIFLVDNETGNTNGSSQTYYLRGASTAQNPLKFAYTASLWAEYYTR